MTATHLPDAHTECNTTGCLNLASTRVAGTPHCAQHARHERTHPDNSATTTLPAKAHQPTARYSNETIRLVVRHWAALKRDPVRGADIDRYDPHLTRALDDLLQEYRGR